MFAQAGQVAARDGLPALRGMTDDVLRFVQCLTIPAAIVLGFLAGPALEVWVGPVYREAAPVVGLLALATVVQTWALAIRQAINGAGRPALSAVLYGAEAVLHIGLGLVLASRYGALGMAEAVLITVLVMEAALMLPLGYKMIGDSVLRPLLRTMRMVGLPVLVMGGLAWVIGRGGGPLYVFADTHGRLVGLIVVGAVGAALMVVFYAVLVATVPADSGNNSSRSSALRWAGCRPGSTRVVHRDEALGGGGVHAARPGAGVQPGFVV